MKLLFIISMITAALCAVISMVAASHYTFILLAALLLAAIHFVSDYIFFVRTQDFTKWFIFLPALCAAIFTVDNVGRLLYSFGLQGFRLFI